MKPLRFYDFMRAAHVKRWHIVKTVHEQTLAEHLLLVSVIALEIFDRMIGAKNDTTGAMKVLMMAMFHDMPETRTGDIPTPAKAFIRGMEIPVPEDIFDAMDNALMPNIPYTGEEWPQTPVLWDIVKVADLIADAWWITENKAGMHSDIVAKGNTRAMMEYVVRLDDNNPGHGWVDVANAVLQELGMPYISMSLRDTPP